MASILNVDQINNAAGTSALEIDSAGNVQIPGHVMQVVQATTATATTTTNTSYVATDLSANITPSSTSNKVAIMVSGRFDNSSTAGGADLTVYRDSTNLGFTSSRLANQYFNRSGNNANQMAVVYLDSPATTSQITYEVRIRSGSSSSTAKFEQAQVIMLMEIAG